MKEFVPPDPAEAELVRQSDEESEEQAKRLENEPSERLRAVLIDTNESEAARGNALLLLLVRKDPPTQQLLPDLFEDRYIGHLAIRYCDLANPIAAERLHALLESPHQRTRAQAALRLAKAKDETVRPYLLEWFHGNDQGERNVAIGCLQELDPPQALELFRQSWDLDDRQENMEDRPGLAAALLSLGDKRGVPLLEAVGRQGTGVWSSFAAFTLLGHNPVLACDILLGIIDDGDAEAKRSVVSQVWNIERNPNAFNEEGIHEARAWVQHHGKQYAAGREVGLQSWVSQ